MAMACLKCSRASSERPSAWWMYPIRLCASGLSGSSSRLFWADKSAPGKSPRLTRSHPRSKWAVNWSIGPRLPMIIGRVRPNVCGSSPTLRRSFARAPEGALRLGRAHTQTGALAPLCSLHGMGRLAIVALFVGGLLLTGACGLAPLPRGAESYGSTNDGVLLSATGLPARGAGFVRAKPADDTRFGARVLIDLLTRS